MKRHNHTLPFHIMLSFPVLILILFNYLPMLGIVMAFQNYKPGLGFFRSQWVGWENFKTLFLYPGIDQIFLNTLSIALGKIVLNLVIPVVFALMLNELRSKWYKKTVQTLTYLPYFLSWVVLSGILIDVLAPDGVVNVLIEALGGKSIYFLGRNEWFQPSIIVSDVWRNFGFNTIVFLAALTNIDPGLYEASSIDGAGRWRQTFHITLPGIAPFVVLMTILGIGNVLNAGFEQIFNLYSPAVYQTGDIIDTLVYRLGLVDHQFSLSTAVGLLKSIVSTILIVFSYKMADKYAGYRVF